MPTIVKHAHDAVFDQQLRAFFAYRDLGTAGASAGQIGAHIIRAVPLEAGARIGQPPGIRHREGAHSDDPGLLEITSPAVFETHPAPAVPAL